MTPKWNEITYSPDTCVFIDPEINRLIASCSKTKGIYKSGVVARNDNKKNRFAASCSDNGRQKHLGYYDNIDEAHEAYCQHKYKIIAKVAESQKEPVKSALLRYKIKSKQCKPEHINVTITKLLRNAARAL